MKALRVLQCGDQRGAVFVYTAIYARVSTGMQAAEGTSLDAQIDLCLRKARDMGIPEGTVKIYREEGFTGEDIDRPALGELRRDVARGAVGRLIVTHPDRLTRDLTDKLILCRELEKNGVELVFVDAEYRNTPEGQLFFNLMSSIAQYELALIRKRTVRGRLKAAEKDKRVMPMRTAPYGYDLVGGRLVINEEEAEIVRRMYRWYVYDRCTLREIGERLYALGALPKRGESRNWSVSSIRRVLSSEVYIGKFYYNRRQTIKIRGEKTRNGAPKRRAVLRDEKDWILIEVPPIVDERLFALAQEKRARNRKNSGHLKHEYLLKSLIRCGHCGRKWQAAVYTGRKDKATGEAKQYLCYRCPNRVPGKFGDGVQRCPSRPLRADRLDDFIWRQILRVLSDPHDYIARLQSRSAELRAELASGAERLRGEIVRLEKEKEKIKLMFRREVVNEEEMLREMRCIDEGLRALRLRLAACEENLAAWAGRELSAPQEELVRNIRRFAESGGQPLAFADKRHIVEMLVEEIRIRFEGDEAKVTALGPLDALLRERASSGNDADLCSQPQKI